MKKRKHFFKILVESFAGHFTALAIILLFIESFSLPAYFLGLGIFILFVSLFLILEFSVMKKLEKANEIKVYPNGLPFIYFFLSTAITIASYISKNSVVQG